MAIWAIMTPQVSIVRITSHLLPFINRTRQRFNCSFASPSKASRMSCLHACLEIFSLDDTILIRLTYTDISLAIFFFHHANIDRYFWNWQRRHDCTDFFEIIPEYPGTNTVDSQYVKTYPIPSRSKSQYPKNLETSTPNFSSPTLSRLSPPPFPTQPTKLNPLQRSHPRPPLRNLAHPNHAPAPLPPPLRKTLHLNRHLPHHHPTKLHLRRHSPNRRALPRETHCYCTRERVPEGKYRWFTHDKRAFCAGV